MKKSAAIQDQPARIMRPLLSAFLSYIERSLRTQFHAVRVLKGGDAPILPQDKPLIVYLNHASWWDPLIMMWLGRRCYPGRPQYGPIEAVQLERYSFFKYLGVFGVEKGTVSGARKFLRVSKRILSEPGAMIWLTPQGRFADVRERPVQFASGIGHLAYHQKDAVFVPLAIEYGFGQERLPEIFVAFGSPLESKILNGDLGNTQNLLEGSLQNVADALSQAVIRRHEEGFDTMLSGSGGASLPYDLWRRVKAMLRRERPNLNHAETS